MRSERRYVKRDPLPRYVMRWPAQSSGQFLVKMAAQHFGFTRSPTPWRRYQLNTPPLAFFHNFLDGSSDATGKDGVGYFAKQFQFSHCPAGFAPAFDDGGHYSQCLVAQFELITTFKSEPQANS
jgi:hypothetical protein